MKEIVAKEEYVELNKLLKFENLVGSGGEAKQAIASGLVKVDGAVETRTRRKVYPGSVVEFGSERLKIVGKPY